MTGLVIVGVAGAAGAMSRHLADIGLRRWFPDGPSVGILVVNVLGSFVLGVLVGSVSVHTVDANLRLAVGTGFCGAFTTFSTFAAELAGLVESRSRGALLRWTALMLVGGGIAAAIGVGLGRSW